MRVGLIYRFVVLVATFTLVAHVCRAVIRPSDTVPVVLEYPREIDLGNRRFSEVIEHPFQIRNTNSREVKLDRLSTSCGCAGVERRTDHGLEQISSLTLPAGGTCELVVRVAVGVRPGNAQQVFVQFRVDEGRASDGLISVLIPRVEGGAVVEPAVVMLGSLRPGEESVQQVELFDNGTANLSVVSVKSSRPTRFEVRSLTLTAADRQKIHPTAGRLVHRIEVRGITTTASRLDGEIEVAFSGGPIAYMEIPVCGDVTTRGLTQRNPTESALVP
jgi:hypothetical protein